MDPREHGLQGMREDSSDEEEQQSADLVLSPGDDDSDKSSGDASKKRKRGSYRCSRCGMPKRGHNCPDNFEGVHFAIVDPPGMIISESNSSMTTVPPIGSHMIIPNSHGLPPAPPSSIIEDKKPNLLEKDYDDLKDENINLRRELSRMHEVLRRAHHIISQFHPDLVRQAASTPFPNTPAPNHMQPPVNMQPYDYQANVPFSRSGLPQSQNAFPAGPQTGMFPNHAQSVSPYASVTAVKTTTTSEVYTHRLNPSPSPSPSHTALSEMSPPPAKRMALSNPEDLSVPRHVNFVPSAGPPPPHSVYHSQQYPPQHHHHMVSVGDHLPEPNHPSYNQHEFEDYEYGNPTGEAAAPFINPLLINQCPTLIY